MFKAIVFVSSILTGVRGSSEEPTARLLLYKSTKTSPVVEGKEFTILYELFNNGDLPARDVQISDRYDPSSFDVVNFENDEGIISAGVDEVLPGGKWSFNITIVPKLFGIYESTRARMRYVSGSFEAESEELESVTRNGYSSTVGRVKIISADEHTKNQTMEAARYAFIGAAVIVPLLGAFYFFNKPDASALNKKVKAAGKKKGGK